MPAFLKKKKICGGGSRHIAENEGNFTYNQVHSDALEVNS